MASKPTEVVEAQPLARQLDRLKAAATRFPRCCDLWQYSLGGMHCRECSQKTFAMMHDIQRLIGVDKACVALTKEGTGDGK